MLTAHADCNVVDMNNNNNNNQCNHICTASTTISPTEQGGGLEERLRQGLARIRFTEVGRREDDTDTFTS